MKEILFRLLMAAALTIAAVALSAPSHGQQAESSQTSPEPAQPGQSSNPSTGGDDQTQDELAFTGHIEQERGTLVLKDPITKLSYQLNDARRARKFIGKQVKVTGKLGLRSNTIQIHTIESIL